MSSTTFSWSSQSSSVSPHTHPSASGNSRPLTPISNSPISGDGVQVENVCDANIEHSLWFYDGTVVLQAGSSLFKLHNSILGARSAVFDDFLNWGQVSSSSIAFFSEGCVFEGYRIVKITDEGKDAKHFFRAIYDSGSVFIPTPIFP